MTTLTFPQINPAQINHILEYIKKEKLQVEISAPQENATKSANGERKRVPIEKIYVPEGTIVELVDDPFNLKR